MIGVVYLFAWHARAETGLPQAAMLSALERRIVQLVVNPAMVITWGIGLWLAWRGGWFSSPWLQAKLGLVVVLSGLHGWAVGAVRSFAEGGQGRGGSLLCRRQYCRRPAHRRGRRARGRQANVMEERGPLLREPRSLPMLNGPP